MIKNTTQIADYQPATPKGLIPFRRFAEAMSEFSDFDAFRKALSRVVMQDTGYAGLLELDADISTMADSEVGQHFEMDSLLVPLSAGHDKGYIRFMGSENGRPFDTEDLMWMGAISEFVSLAYANSKAHHDNQNKARIFQYLINQLPLGVVCFGSEGELIVENRLASRLLSQSGAELLRGALSDKALLKKGKVRLHLEIEGKLLYAEGRRLEVEEGVSVSAFVLHDMSGQREKLMLQLERSVYRAESRGVPLTVAVLEDHSEAGRLYRELKATADSLQLEPASISSLDAYTCVCIFTDKSLRSVRYLLKRVLSRSMDRETIEGAFISQVDSPGDDSLAQGLIDSARAAILPLRELLRPALLVLDPYPAVIDALDLIAGEINSFQQVESVEQAVAQIRTGGFDGLFLDIETYGAEGLDWLIEASAKAGAGFKVFYLSHKQPAMVYSNYGLGVEATVFQKPFDAQKLRETLALQFDFA